MDSPFVVNKKSIIMKSQIFLFFFLLSTFSCIKLDEISTIQLEDVIGKWQINSFAINSCPNGEDNLEMTFANENGCIDIRGNENCISILMLENGEAEIQFGDIGIVTEFQKFTYKIGEYNNEINLCSQITSDCTTYSIQDNILYTERDKLGCITVLGYKKV